jgi:hypothetical protein
MGFQAAIARTNTQLSFISHFPASDSLGQTYEKKKLVHLGRRTEFPFNDTFAFFSLQLRCIRSSVSFITD